jgi:hypothetical protein
MIESSASVTDGVVDPDRPGFWLVRPWPVRAGVHDVVRHFLNAGVWHLRSDASAACRSAYYEGYAAALEAAPTHDLTCPTGWKWYRELHDQVERCVAIHWNAGE